MTSLKIEGATRAGSMMELTTAVAPIGLFLGLTGATRDVAAAFTETVSRGRMSETAQNTEITRYYHPGQ